MLEFSSADEMMAHYKAVRARTRYWSPVAKPKPIPPEPIVVEVQASPTPYKYKPRWHFLDFRYDLVEPPDPPRILIADIVREVARFYEITEIDLLAARRLRSIAHPRQVAMYLAKTLTLKSLVEIGRRLADRDHTTILHGVRAVTKRIATDPALAADIADIKQALQG